MLCNEVINLTTLLSEGGRDPLQNCFQIISPKKSFLVISKSREEKYQWMSAIMTAIDEEVKRKQTLARKEKTVRNLPWCTCRSSRIGSTNGTQTISQDTGGFEAPVWVQDKDATHCFKCHDEFTFVNRRVRSQKNILICIFEERLATSDKKIIST